MIGGDQELRVVNWGFDHLAARSMLAVANEEKKKRIQDTLGHFATAHVCGGVSVHLMTLPELTWMVKKSPVLCRDGLVPLADFFYRNRTPPGRLRLLVHEDALAIVPRRWRPVVTGFNYKTDVTFNAGLKPKRLILAGVVHPLYSSEAALVRALNPLIEAWGRDFHESMEILVHFRHCAWLGVHNSSLEDLWRFTRRLHSLIGSEYKLANYNDLLQISNELPTAYLEINAGLVQCDSYIRHLVHSKGIGQVRIEGSDHESSEVIACSPFHSIITFPVPEDTPMIDWPEQEQIEVYKRLAENLGGERDSLWRSWIELWIAHAKDFGR
jgi:hypothetical protein